MGWLGMKGASSPLRFMRRPRVIVAEVGLLTAALAAMTLVPQSTASDTAAFEAFVRAWPRWSTAVRAVGLDHVVSSAWFLALVALASISLSLLQVEQWRRLSRLWGDRAGASDFARADFRRRWEREATREGAWEEITTRGRLGLLGSPLFHCGLLLVILAGLLRMLIGRDAVIDLVEGERLKPTAEVWGASWGGPLAAPFATPAPLVFRSLHVARYPSGELEELSATLDLLGHEGRGLEELAVNTPLDMGSERIYMTLENGPAALVEMQSPEGAERRAIMLHGKAPGVYEATDTFPGGFELRLRARTGKSAGLPAGMELRVLQGGVLRHLGRLRPGDATPVAAKRVIRMHGIVWWARFRGSRDHSLGVAWLGLGVLCAGALLMFGVVRVDTLVRIAPLKDGRERVTVALRASRFAPLYRDAFDRLVAEAGGDVEGGDVEGGDVEGGDVEGDAGRDGVER